MIESRVYRLAPVIVKDARLARRRNQLTSAARFKVFRHARAPILTSSRKVSLYISFVSITCVVFILPRFRISFHSGFLLPLLRLPGTASHERSQSPMGPGALEQMRNATLAM